MLGLGIHGLIYAQKLQSIHEYETVCNLKKFGLDNVNSYSSRHSPIDELLKWTKKDTRFTKATRYARVFVRDQSIETNNERRNSKFYVYAH